MRSRLLAGAATLALAAAGLTIATAGPASADCSHTRHPDEYNNGGIYWKDGTRIRSGPHGGCGIRGLGYPGEGINVHCAVLSAHTNWNVWVFVRDRNDGTRGWAHENALRIPGSWKSVPDCWSGEHIAVG